MDKKYIENQYHLAVLDFHTARNEDEQWEARKTMARLEQNRNMVLHTQMNCTKKK